MARDDFYFPLHYHKLLTATIGWTDEEFGAYVRLLIAQFDKGNIPADMKELKRIAPSIKRSWKLIANKFHDDGAGGMINDFMDIIRQDVNRKKEKNRDNGSRGGRPKKSKAIGIPDESEMKPDGFENETQTKGILIVNSKYKKEREETHMPKEIWNSKPGTEATNLLLPELKAGAVRELFYISKNTQVTDSQIESLWNVFKAQNFNGEKFYSSANQVFSHFINWCRMQDVKTLQEEKAKVNHMQLSPRELRDKQILDSIK